MIYERECVFADAVKPIRMRYPFNIKFGADVGNSTQVGSRIEFIKNDPVINPFDLCFFSIQVIEQISTFFNKFGYAYRFYSGEVFRTIKIDPCFFAREVLSQEE